MSKIQLSQASRSGMRLHPEPTGEFTIQVDAWDLPAPQIEYFADDCTARIVRGSPTMFFAQRGTDDTVVNAVAIAMPPNRFKDMVDAFQKVLDLVSPEEQDAGRRLEPTEIHVSGSANFRKYMASVVRGGTAPEGSMIDFYRVALAANQQVKGGQIPEDIVQPCIRIFMTPTTLVHLFETIKRQGMVS